MSMLGAWRTLLSNRWKGAQTHGAHNRVVGDDRPVRHLAHGRLLQDA